MRTLENKTHGSSDSNSRIMVSKSVVVVPNKNRLGLPFNGLLNSSNYVPVAHLQAEKGNNAEILKPTQNLYIKMKKEQFPFPKSAESREK